MSSRGIWTLTGICLVFAVAVIGVMAADESAVRAADQTLFANMETPGRCESPLGIDGLAKWKAGDDDDDDGDYCVCHMPPGNPDNAETICGGAASVCAHLAHGDMLGECPSSCGGPEGTPCDEGQFCKVPEGECAPDAAGTCTALPAVCPSDYAPVCGCDGNTYSNACYADAAGVAVESQGECAAGVACGGAAGDTCGMDHYCRTAAGDCADDAAGQCADIPEACPRIIAPVCGCDGTTYDNACLADAAGVTVSSKGECPKVRGRSRRF